MTALLQPVLESTRFSLNGVQRACIRGAKDHVDGLDIVGKSYPGLGLSSGREPVIEVAADSQIERPVALGDRVLNVQRKLLYVGVAQERVQRAVRAGAIRRRRWIWPG